MHAIAIKKQTSEPGEVAVPARMKSDAIAEAVPIATSTHENKDER